MKLVQVGSVGKPHGYRGEFLLSARLSSGELPEGVDIVYLGPDEEKAQAFTVEEVREMAKGLRLKLAGMESDAAVKSHTGEAVYIDRQELPEAEDGEFYVQDLVGCAVRDAETDADLGT